MVFGFSVGEAFVSAKSAVAVTVPVIASLFHLLLLGRSRSIPSLFTRPCEGHCEMWVVSHYSALGLQQY